MTENGWGLDPWGLTPWGGSNVPPFVYPVAPPLASGVCVDMGLSEGPPGQITFVVGWDLPMQDE